jgi:hypothetical protein
MLSYHRRISDVTVLASQIYRAWAYRYRQPAVGADLRKLPGDQRGRLGDAALPTPQSATRVQSAVSTTGSWLTPSHRPLLASTRDQFLQNDKHQKQRSDHNLGPPTIKRPIKNNDLLD